MPVLVTGEIDSYVIMGTTDYENGHFYQATITGSGCILGSFVLRFCSDQSYEVVVKNFLYNIAAEKGLTKWWSKSI